MIALAGVLTTGAQTHHLLVRPPSPLPAGRSWVLAIIGLRVEGAATFVRSHQTAGTPQRIYLGGSARALITWPETPENTPVTPIAIGAQSSPPLDPAQLAARRFHLAMHDGARLLGETSSASPADHAYANVFAKWEPGPAGPRLIECGYELTAFAVPTPGVKHTRVVLAAHPPGDPSRPRAIQITLRVVR